MVYMICHSSSSQLSHDARSWVQGFFWTRWTLFSQSHIQFAVCHHTDLMSGTDRFQILMDKMLVASETWNLPKISKFCMSVKSARKTGCFVKCPQPLIFTWDFKKIPQERKLPFWYFNPWIFLKFHHLALESSFK